MKTFGKIICVVLCFSLLLPYCFCASAAQKELSLDAKGAVLTDVGTGEVLYERDAHKRLFPASITKIMSLILVMEALDSGKIKLTDKVTASRYAVSFGGSQIWLKEGETMSVDELLKAVVVASANDACTALGEYVAGSADAFVEQMNQKAKALGMKNSHFENCTGLDESETNHYSTAFDIALMSRELMRHELIKNYSTIRLDSLRNGETMLVNTNKLMSSYNGCIGLKTGTTTKAGFCVSAVAERDGTTLCAVILGSENSEERFRSAARLLDYGFGNFETAHPDVDLTQSGEVKVLSGMESIAQPVLAEENPAFTVKKGERESVASRISLKSAVKAPVKKGDVLGKVEFFAGDKYLGGVDLVAGKDIGRLTFWQAVLRLLKSTVHSDLAH